MTNNYPVIYFVFKRPQSTLRFLELMKEAGIRKIYIFGDGPRSVEDKVVTDQVRHKIQIFKSTSPDIEIIESYAVTNVGLKENIINGLNLAFSKESAAIIVEDDCLPTLDFFRFCSEMLAMYKDDKNIMSINGTSAGGITDFSYDFTKYAQCWGWATWARSWRLYDPKLTHFHKSTWPGIAKDLGMNHLMQWYWGTMLTVVKAGWINTWDFQWSYAHFIHHALSIAPTHNLVQNIGFDSVATNTKTKTKAADMPTHVLKFPLIHPQVIRENLSFSNNIERRFYGNPIAILGLIRQYIYWQWSKYAHRS